MVHTHVLYMADTMIYHRVFNVLCIVCILCIIWVYFCIVHNLCIIMFVFITFITTQKFNLMLLIYSYKWIYPIYLSHIFFIYCKAFLAGTYVNKISINISLTQT